MKRWIMYGIALCLLLSLAVPAAATENTEATQETAAATEAAPDPSATSGTCGEGLTWVLEGTTLTISGSGDMEDGAPWAAHKKKIERVVLTGGVTRIGAEAFSGYDRLESVDFGNALVEIGERAFYNCPDLTVIHLPATFRRFGAECFRECTGLKYVYCDGGMPRFNSSCLWTGNYVAVFYPTNNPWSAEYTKPLIDSYGGKLGIMMGNYDAAAIGGQQEKKQEETEPTRETRPPETQPQTEPAVTEPAVTEPATVPTEPEPTEPETEPTAAPTLPPETEAVTEPVQTQTEETAPAETEQEDMMQVLGSNGWILIVAAAVLVTLLAAGVLIFRSIRNKGGKYIE